MAGSGVLYVGVFGMPDKVSVDRSRVVADDLETGFREQSFGILYRHKRRDEDDSFYQCQAPKLARINWKVWSSVSWRRPACASTQRLSAE